MRSMTTYMSYLLSSPDIVVMATPNVIAVVGADVGVVL